MVGQIVLRFVPQAAAPANVGMACAGIEWPTYRHVDARAVPARVGVPPRGAGVTRGFAHYTQDDVWRALLATMDLFRWLSEESAELLGYGYPSYGADRASELLAALSAPGR